MTSVTAHRQHLSLEPPPVQAPPDEGEDELDLFRPYARLIDVTEDGQPVFTREPAPTQPEGLRLSDRLLRIWSERGDFAQVTAERIRADSGKATAEADDGADTDPRLTAEGMKELQNGIMEQLALARTELTMALDLLSVVAPPTDPPSVDVESLPLPSMTLGIVPTVPPSSQSHLDDSSDAAKLPLATSLASIKSSAAAFFATADELLGSTSIPATASAPAKRRAPTKPTPIWPTLLHLRATTSFSLLPLSCLPNATLTGKNESRQAKQVGVFFGLEEAREAWRRGSVVRALELLDDVGASEADAASVGRAKKQAVAAAEARSGRQMVVEIESEGGKRERAVWRDMDVRSSHENGIGRSTGPTARAVETLEARRRAAFAEELFATLSYEARNDVSLKANMELGSKREGDSVVVNGHGWKLRITMVLRLPPSTTADDGSTASIVLPLLRLLFLEEYARRRRSSSADPQAQYIRPILHTLSTFLNHTTRVRTLSVILEEQENALRAAGLTPELEFWGSTGQQWAPVLPMAAREAVARILVGAKELGGRAVLRAGKSIVYHVSFSLMLPHLATPTPVATSAGHESLVLHAPRSSPVPTSSTAHLRLFLSEQVATVVAAAARKT